MIQAAHASFEGVLLLHDHLHLILLDLLGSKAVSERCLFESSEQPRVGFLDFFKVIIFFEAHHGEVPS